MLHQRLLPLGGQYAGRGLCTSPLSVVQGYKCLLFFSKKNDGKNLVGEGGQLADLGFVPQFSVMHWYKCCLRMV